MSDIPGFPYRLLWEERELRSVANLTRRDAKDFLALAGDVQIRRRSRPIRSMRRTGRWPTCAKEGRLQGAAVLVS